jgi:hypothetical protein
MKYNPRGSLQFLVRLTAALAFMLSVMSYIFIAIIATTWIGHYFNLPVVVSNLMGLGIFLLLPITVLAGFVQD